MPLIRKKQKFTQEKIAEKAYFPRFCKYFFQPKLNIKEQNQEKLFQRRKMKNF